MGDITNPRLLYLKGGLFVVCGLLASALLLWECPSVKVAVLLAIAIWSFARAYYFAFYVVQHYADPGYRFAGLWSFVRYALMRRRGEGAQSPTSWIAGVQPRETVHPPKESHMKITVEATVATPIETVWRAWTTPEDIKQWNAASDDWHTTAATVDLRVGGVFSSRMEAKDGSMGFDFAGTYTKIVPHELIECSFGDRVLSVQFIQSDTGVTVRESFDAEQTHSAE